MVKKEFVVNTQTVLIRMLFALALIFPATVTFSQTQEKIFCDKEGNICSESNAETYAIINFDQQGNPVGKLYEYYVTGELRGETEGALYVDKYDASKSKYFGRSKGFYKSGAKEIEIYRDKQGNFVREKVWFENGNLKYDLKFKDGKPNGKYIFYHENGKIQQKGSFKDGEYDGRIVDYHENGKLAVRYTMKDGELDGDFTEYDEDGKITKKGTYMDGKPLYKDTSPEFALIFQNLGRVGAFFSNIWDLSLQDIFFFLDNAKTFILIILVVVACALFNGLARTHSEILSEQEVVMSKQNKIINVALTGGIIGFLVSSPQQRLNAKIKEVNAEGWRVVRIIPSSSGNLLLFLGRLFLLCITLFLYTTKNGFYVVIEKVDNGSNRQA